LSECRGYTPWSSVYGCDVESWIQYIPSFLCAKLCHFDSQGVAMRIVPPIKMHNDFQERYTVHRERLYEALSLDLALLSKNIVHFYRPDDPQRGRRGWLEVSAFHHTTGRSYQHLNCVNIAPTTYELSARGRIFDGLFERANDPIISIAMNSMRANASATSYWTILILVITTRPVATASSHSARTTSCKYMPPNVYLF
jgi:hypothetical protein